MQNDKRFNLIGFGLSKHGWRWQDDGCGPVEEPIRHCVIHIGRRLLRSEDPAVMFCPECGMRYNLNLNEAPPGEDTLKTKIPVNQKPKIISGKGRRKKRYTDKFGTEVNDPDLIRDIQAGVTVVSYREQKSGKEKKVHVVRK